MSGGRPGAERLFLADSVAIVGASDSSEGFSPALYENLRAGFAGRLFFINPRRSTIWGEPCYPDFAHVGQPIDLALVVVPGPAVPAILEEGAANGLGAALLYNEAFGKPGSDEDRIAAERVRRLTAQHGGLRIAGPNSLGALSLARGGTFYPMRSMAALPAGNVGIVSASGGALQHWMLQGAARGLGFSYAVSTGNEIDLGLADYIEFLAHDEATRVISVIAEGVREPRAFARAAARALAARKPIVILKAGRSAGAQRSVASHTGALAGDDDVFNAVCERYGICRVPSLDDLLEVALAFSRGRIPNGAGVAMLCHSGGIKGHFLDAAEDAGLTLAEFGPATVARLSELGGFRSTTRSTAACASRCAPTNTARCAARLRPTRTSTSSLCKGVSPAAKRIRRTNSPPTTPSSTESRSRSWRSNAWPTTRIAPYRPRRRCRSCKVFRRRCERSALSSRMGTMSVTHRARRRQSKASSRCGRQLRRRPQRGCVKC